MQTCTQCCSDCGSAFAAGVYRLLDRGKIWQLISGLNGMNDRRFSALPSGCGANIIYTGNGSTNLYKGIDHFPSKDASNLYAPTKYVLRRLQERVNVTAALSSTPTPIPDEITYEPGFDPAQCFRWISINEVTGNYLQDGI